jgi:antitoxin component YwqK of YwqJK toxin-antitoxin module
MLFFSCGKESDIYKIVKKYNKSGSIEEEYALNKTGEIDCYYKSFYSDGKVKVYTEIEYGQKNGVSIEYYESGILSRIVPYKKGSITGKEIQFYKNGILKGIRSFKNNIIDGLVIIFYENGFMKTKYYRKNNHFIGNVYEYYDNSFLKKYKFFSDNGELAYIREYNRNGRFIKEEGSAVVVSFLDKVKKKEISIFPLIVKVIDPPNTKSLIKFFQYNKPNNILKYFEIKDTTLINYQLNTKYGTKLKLVVEIDNGKSISEFGKELEFPEK